MNHIKGEVLLQGSAAGRVRVKACEAHRRYPRGVVVLEEDILELLPKSEDSIEQCF